MAFKKRVPHHAKVSLKINRGQLKGRTVFFYERPGLRPSLAKVRQAVGNLTAPYVHSHGFIDLCAGSGAIGFEAQSMGFEPTIMIEPDARTAQTLAQNAANLEVSPLIIHATARDLVLQSLPVKPYILYADPPFSLTGFHREMLEVLSGCSFLAEGSRYYAESGDALPEPCPAWRCLSQKRYGRIWLTCLQYRAAD